MKALLKISIFLFVLFSQSGTFGQALLDFKYDDEPFRPLYLEHNAFKGMVKSEMVNGKFVATKETEEEYNKRNTEFKKKLYSDYIESAAYKKWLSEHLEWRNRNANWKKRTRYPDLLGPIIIQDESIPKRVIGESYIVTANSLNFRNKPTNTSSIVTTLKIGDKVELINTENVDWWFVKYGLTEGYVFSRYLEVDKFGEWLKVDYRSGSTPDCENVSPKYDYDLDNYLRIVVGSKKDVVVKLMKIGSFGDECIRVVYVRNGDTYSIKNIPESRYYLKIAYGSDYRKKIVNDQCYVKFMRNALYEKGIEILDFRKTQEANDIIDDKVYKNWSIPSYELSLDIIERDIAIPTFRSNEISESELRV